MRYKVYKRGGYNVGAISVAGGESLNPVTLSRDPVADLEAATKGYVDAKAANLSSDAFSQGVLAGTRTPEFTGDLVKLDGVVDTTIKPTTVTPGSYAKVTVNAKGQVTAGDALIEGDIPELPWSKLTSGLPTTLGGYGITEALSLNGGTMTGPLRVGTVGSSPGSLVNKSFVDAMGNNGSPVNTAVVVYKALQTTPVGFLRCNGGAVDKTTYADLYAVIGDRFTLTSDQMTGAGKPWKQQFDINTEQTGDITGWTTGTSLPTALGFSQAIVTKNRVYLLGGYNGSSYVSTVYTAPINADGTLGTWTTGTRLPGVLAYSQAIVTKNRVYLLGGADGYGRTSTVYTAPINTDGTLGTWTTGTSLPVILGQSQAIVTKNRVYLLGGYGNSTVYTAPINADGTLGAWTTDTSLPGALGHSQAIVTKNRVYLLGGHNGSSWVSTVYTAPINTDGTLGTWTTGTSLPAALGSSQAIVTKNRVYLLGGYSSSGNYVSTVYTAPILGGLNDYSPYYDGTFVPVALDPNIFYLPDIQTELYGTVAYIKY